MTVHKITLTYELDPENLTSHAKAMNIQKGDTLEFVSDAGPVRVLMKPGHKFSVGEFRTGDDPVMVTAAGPFGFCCGVNVGGKVLGYPLHQRFGEDPIPVGPGTRTPVG